MHFFLAEFAAEANGNCVQLDVVTRQYDFKPIYSIVRLDAIPYKFYGRVKQLNPVL